MRLLKNPWRESGFPDVFPPETPFPSIDAARVASLLRQCPAHAETPLRNARDLAAHLGIAELRVKDERDRMGLGSFKALGAAYVIASEAAERGNPGPESLTDMTYVTASAGNHGLSVAAGARIFGAKAKVFIAQTVPQSFAERLAAKGADVVREGADYEASMKAAARAADDNGWQLLSDSSWPGYMDRPWRLMEGYLQLAAEAADQMGQAPTHIFLQAGVGGLAGAVAAYARHIWGDAPIIIVVEPEEAPALYESIEAGKPVVAEGGVSCMGRLDCKEPSLIALKGLARDADVFMTLSEGTAEAAIPPLVAAGLATTPSGGAGLAALLALGGKAEGAGLNANSRVLTILSEEA
ncbi:pyridoxal-phosphate dependent enzyme [Rhizobium sp. L1K21]|uniref:pyridoxal-phosphate dependent enzyme n=1 Tax=Rhizobium sp. L1K21 TaxID=2954933 RepID=UPI0020938A94|nr:pyridoxal-phosphate dependent enzyme [Rhizobium sp. L1K21]MCO6186785.1 pyridoxal-phosphate dependent enzyme [Rhizobium sp. L1K21]